MFVSTFLSIVIFYTTSFNSLGRAFLFEPAVLSESSMSLDNRQPDRYVNEIFKDNILLNMAYLNGSVTKASEIDWDKIRKPSSYSFTLESGQAFAYHDTTLPEFKNKVVKTTRAHFNAREGFKSDGYLAGDGVCHLASLLNWAAKDAGLSVLAPVNHDFAVIPDVPKKEGVAIYNSGRFNSADASQNLYITNNRQNPVTFKFDFDGNKLKIAVLGSGGSIQ